jgi:hypothetical protein
MTQFFLAAFGLTSIWFAMGHNARLRRWAPVIGLCGQPFWFAFALETKAGAARMPRGSSMAFAWPESKTLEIL